MTGWNEVFSDVEIEKLDALMEEWQNDDELQNYGWDGAPVGADFVEFWLDGEGYGQVMEIIGDEGDYRAAVRYLTSICR